jgi:hypothetical protein
LSSPRGCRLHDIGRLSKRKDVLRLNRTWQCPGGPMPSRIADDAVCGWATSPPRSPPGTDPADCSCLRGGKSGRSKCAASVIDSRHAAVVMRHGRQRAWTRTNSNPLGASRKAKTPLGEAGLSNQTVAGSRGRWGGPSYLPNMYPAAVSGVFRRPKIWFRGLWRNPGHGFAVCGDNPAGRDFGGFPASVAASPASAHAARRQDESRAAFNQSPAAANA